MNEEPALKGNFEVMALAARVCDYARGFMPEEEHELWVQEMLDAGEEALAIRFAFASAAEVGHPVPRDMLEEALTLLPNDEAIVRLASQLLSS